MSLYIQTIAIIDRLIMEYKGFTTDDFITDAFFIRWAKGEPESDWFWKSFMREHPDKVSAIEEARKIVTSISFSTSTLPSESLDSMRNQLIMTLHAHKQSEKENLKVRPAHAKTFWIKVAAAIILPLAGSLILYYSILRPDTLAINSGARTLEERVNPRGQKSVLLLADGTKIWLNADSKLTYAKNFNKGVTRDVYLQGEAFFEVAHNATKPFIVHTSELDIRVLGTSFNVKSYDEDQKIETTLLEGQVKINVAESPDEASLILAPNQKAVFQKETRVLDVEQVQAERSSAWRQEKLVFDETTYGEVIVQLERWYNVKIIIEDEGNLHCKLTANIEKESLEDVLNLLVISHKISYRISGSDIYIKGTLCQ